MLIKWWLLLESNQRHQDFQSCALPTELRSHKMVARGRFELPHARVKVVCLTAWLPGNNGYSLKKSSSNCSFNFSFSSLYLPLRAVTFL